MLNAEDNPGDPAALKAASNLPQLVAQRPHKAHADRPRELDVRDVFANGPPVLRVKRLEPFANRSRPLSER